MHMRYRKGCYNLSIPNKDRNVFPFSCFCSSDKKYLCFAGSLRTMLTLDVLFQHWSPVLSQKNLDFHPAVSLFIAVPALFSVFTPGDALVSVKIGGLSIIITRQGLLGALLFVVRVTTAVSFVVLLSITTKHFELLRVLRIFRIPQVFVMTLGMCYRYLFLFVELVENTYQAIKSRVGTGIHYKRDKL